MATVASPSPPPAPRVDARVWPHRQPKRASIEKCATLALLLHIWLVLIIGTSPGSSPDRTGGVEGPLSVTLQGVPTPDAARSRAESQTSTPAPINATPSTSSTPGALSGAAQEPSAATRDQIDSAPAKSVPNTERVETPPESTTGAATPEIPAPAQTPVPQTPGVPDVTIIPQPAPEEHRELPLLALPPAPEPTPKIELPPTVPAERAEAPQAIASQALVKAVPSAESPRFERIEPLPPTARALQLRPAIPAEPPLPAKMTAPTMRTSERLTPQATAEMPSAPAEPLPSRIATPAIRPSERLTPQVTAEMPSAPVQPLPPKIASPTLRPSERLTPQVTAEMPSTPSEPLPPKIAAPPISASERLAPRLPPRDTAETPVDVPARAAVPAPPTLPAAMPSAVPSAAQPAMPPAVPSTVPSVTQSTPSTPSPTAPPVEGKSIPQGIEPSAAPDGSRATTVPTRAPGTPGSAGTQSTGASPSSGTSGTPGTSAASQTNTPTPPSTAGGGVRPLDLGIHPRNGPTLGRGSIGLLPLLPAPPERKSKLTEGMEKAARPDCRTAYSDKGLLAAAPLAGAAISDKGCRW